MKRAPAAPLGFRKVPRTLALLLAVVLATVALAGAQAATAQTGPASSPQAQDPRQLPEEEVPFVVIGVLALTIIPVVLGIRAAKRKGVSPHWMWFGLHPVGGWIAYLIIRRRPDRWPAPPLRPQPVLVTPPTKPAAASPPQPWLAIPTPDLRGLVREILEHASVVMGDRSQPERLGRLIEIGPPAIPPIEEAIRSAIRGSERGSEFENAGLLCEAVGRIGGAAAFDALKRFALQDSNVWEYQHVRRGAVRGLAHLGDQRAATVLAQVSERFGLDSEVADALRAIGIEAPRAPIPMPKPDWAGSATTWDRIAEAFIATQLQESAPDFEGFSQLVDQFDGKRRHGAWHMVGFAYRKRGDGRKASQCFVQALLRDTDPALSSTAWGLIELPSGRPELSALSERLKTAAGHASGSRDLALELSTVLGVPGA